MVQNDRDSVAHFTIITTNECSARCAHCMMHSAPDRTECLSSRQITRALDELMETTDVGVMVFAGGEPTSLEEELFEAIAEAELRGVPTRIVTNAEWADTEESAKTMVTQLRDSGLRELNFSTDDFHSVWIPLENIRRAWNASKGMGFDSVVLAVCAGPRSRVTPESLCELLQEEIPLRYDELGHELPLPEPDVDGTRYLISNSRIYRIGRGSGLRDDYITDPGDALGNQMGCPHIGDNPTLDATGGWGVCCGLNPEMNPRLNVGNIEESTVTDLIERQRNDWLLGAIRQFGPQILLDTLKSMDPTVQTRSNYASICEACQDLVRLPDTTLSRLRDSGFLRVASNLVGTH